MKIDFSRNQMQTLAELVYLGAWMTDAIRQPDEQIQRYADLEQYIFAQARRFGLACVEFDEASRTHYPTKEFEEEMDECVGEYDNEAFWQELIERMADRDFLSEFGETADKMSPDERFQKVYPLQERYQEEFSENGIDRLKIITP